MIRTHLSQDPKLQLVDRGRNTFAAYKPVGFWYQIDDDWERWMNSEEWYMSYNSKYSVDVSQVNLLEARTPKDLDRITELYQKPLIESVSTDSPHYNTLDWQRLFKLYDGFEIAPYIWERRLEYMWYYGWDCASGVIWDISNVKIEFLEEVNYGATDRQTELRRARGV